MSEAAEMQAQLEEMQAIQREFRELVKCKGWGRLRNYAEAQIEARQNALLDPSDGFDGLVAGEFSKGEVGGIALFMRFPEIIEADYGERVEELLKEIRANDGQDSD